MTGCKRCRRVLRNFFMKTKKNTAISLQKVNKEYILHHEKPTFVENIIKRGYQEKFVAINNLNLEIAQGEKVGIIGANGAGKTTILKLIAGITSPTSGKVSINGKVVSLIDVAAGFHPDLTGEENIFLNGLLIGMSKDEIQQKFDEIVSFADIGKFIDSPLYTYSAGMNLRLGFSIAIHSDPDILLLDEGVVAGDENFSKKISEKIKYFFNSGKTVILASHWLDYLHQNCNRIIWVDAGEIIRDGSINLLREYKKDY